MYLLEIEKNTFYSACAIYRCHWRLEIWDLKEKYGPGFNRKSKKFQTLTVNNCSKSDKKWGRYEILNFHYFHRNISSTVNMNMQMSELMMSSHNFLCILFTEMMKFLYFRYEKLKLAAYALWINAECLLWYILIWGHVYIFEQKKNNFKILYTKYMKNCEAMRSTHLHNYLYRLFKNVLLKITKIWHFLSYFLSDLHQIFTVQSKCFSYTLCIELT